MKKVWYCILSVLILVSSVCLVFSACDKTENKFGLMSVGEMKGGSDKQAKKLKKDILSAPDTLKKASDENLVYYVSEDGSEWNDGLSPEKPTTVDEVNSLYLTKGDVVLFKRGDTFRLEEEIKPVRGISYGAYGEGDKPVFLGSLKNYADKSLWTSEDNNIWQIYLGTEDAAQVIFNDCEYIGYRKHTFEEVTSNGDFFFDYDKKTLYLYLTNTNPGEYFDSIEIATTKRAIGTFGSNASKLTNLKFENLCIKYFCTFAFNVSYADGFEITNCEMGWIGGEITASKTNRYGNAVQFWNNANNVNVSNNYIYQIFDAAITFQGMSNNNYTNLTFKNNLIEYTSMNFEFWGKNPKTRTETSSDSNAVMHNITFQDNILRFSGYNWGGEQRKGKESQAFVLAWSTYYDKGQVKNFNITNNIFDTANSYFFFAQNATKHINISGNTYYQQPGSTIPVLRLQKELANNLEAFENAIKTVDTNPTKIEWID